MRMVVVLPLPLGPIKPKTLPSGTLRERSSTAVTSPKVLVTLEISTAGIGMVGAVFQSGISLRFVQHKAPSRYNRGFGSRARTGEASAPNFGLGYPTSAFWSSSPLSGL